MAYHNGVHKKAYLAGEVRLREFDSDKGDQNYAEVIYRDRQKGMAVC